MCHDVSGLKFRHRFVTNHFIVTTAIITAWPLLLSFILATDAVITTSHSNNNNNNNNNSCPTQCQCATGTSKHLRGYFETVDCRNRKLVRVPPLRSFSSNAAIVQLRGNFISSFAPTPGDLDGLVSLRELDLSYNRISSLDLSALNGTSVKVINLNSNMLEALSSAYSMESARQLEVLEIANNRIAELEADCFNGMENLLALTLSGNRLKELRAGAFLGLKALRVLNVDRSQLVTISGQTFKGLANLETLTLVSNELAQIPRNAFEGVETLKYLNLASNRFEILPAEAMLVFTNLKSVQFDSNPTRKLTRRSLASFGVQELSLRRMTSLELIDAEAFYNLRRLTAVHIADNPRLVYVDANAFVDCAKITLLDFANNNLRAFSEELKNGLKEMKNVDLRGNALRCDDCTNRWMIEYDRGVYQNSNNNNNNSNIPFRMELSEMRMCGGINTNRTERRLPTERDKELLMTSQVAGSASEFSLTHTGSAPDNSNASESAVTAQNGTDTGGGCSPQLIRFFNDTIYHELGATLVIDCRAVGLPVPVLFWIFANRTLINSTSNNSRARMSSGGTLTVDHVKQTDSGRYKCVASNDYGTDSFTTRLRVYSSTARVIVQTIGADFVTITWSGTDKTISSVQYVIVYRLSDPLPVPASLYDGPGVEPTSALFPAALSPPLRPLPAEQRRGAYGRIPLRQYMRTYWITNLDPGSLYEICMTYERTDDHSYVKIDCSHVQTRGGDAFAMASHDDGIYRVASRAVLAAILVTCAAPLVVCILVVWWRRIRWRKTYADPGGVIGSEMAAGTTSAFKDARTVGRVDVTRTMSNIPLDNLYRPPSTALLYSSTTSLISYS